MARRYGQPITVTLAAGDLPTSFTWRMRRYWVQVLSIWRLSSHWWDPTQAIDRIYYRVETTADCLLFEVYHDLLSDAWVLDVCHD